MRRVFAGSSARWKSARSAGTWLGSNTAPANLDPLLRDLKASAVKSASLPRLGGCQLWRKTSACGSSSAPTKGRQIARAKGVRMRRKPKLTPHQVKEARQRIAQGEPTRSLAKSYGVSISTISRLAA